MMKMMLMPYTTTATQLQRNYKKLVQKAKKVKAPIVILSNNQPQGVYIDYETFSTQQNTVKDEGKERYSAKGKGKNDFSEFLGRWTKEEGEEFDKIIEQAFEQINPEEWK